MIKTENVGKHENVTVVEFGTGDIAITNCSEKGDECHRAIYLSQHIQKPIEEWENKVYQPGMTSDEMELPIVVLRFGRTESIDSLIASLHDLKAKYNKSEQ